MYRKLLIVCLALVLAACQGAPVFGPTPTPFPDQFEGKATVSEHTLPIWCEGSGEPTIILENGFGDGRVWTKVDNARFSKITRTCYYDRLGIATHVTFAEPRTVMDQVKELHTLLQQTGVPGPYILVGALGGANNLILYSNQYPQDVAGLVVVQPWYPTFYDYYLGKLGPVMTGTSAQRKAEIQFVTDYKVKKVMTWDTHPEFLDQVASEAQVLTVASLKDVPLTIVESEIFYNSFSEAEMNQINTDSVKESNQDFCKLSRNCRMVMVPGTDLLSIAYNRGVDKAIQEMYDAVKSGQ